MTEVSIFRLYALRATYLLIVVGLGFMIWPKILGPAQDTEHMQGVVRCVLAGVSILALIGLRYPLQMLPVLLFEMLWKSIWLLEIGLPLWRSGTFTAGTAATWNDCMVSVVIFAVVIPWKYVFVNYVRRPGNQWRASTARAAVAIPE